MYVPNSRSGSVTIIDPRTYQVVRTFPTGRIPQHVVPSWDLKTLWVTNNAEGRTDGTLTPIDPVTGKPGNEIAVEVDARGHPGYLATARILGEASTRTIRAAAGSIGLKFERRL